MMNHASLASLVALALSAFAVRASDAVEVVACAPTHGLAPTIAVNPGLVNSASPNASYGMHLETTFGGCTANAAQLAAWAPSKLGGTPNGALIAEADIKLKAKGFGTCAWFFADATHYPPSGKLQVKWRDVSGRSVPMTKPSDAYVRVNLDLGTFSIVANGIVTKGLGMGAYISSSLGFLDVANPVNEPFSDCNAGPYSGASITQLALITNASSGLTIELP